MQFWNTAIPILSRAVFAAMAEMSTETETTNAADSFTEKVCQTLNWTINTENETNSQ